MSTKLASKLPCSLLSKQPPPTTEKSSPKNPRPPRKETHFSSACRALYHHDDVHSNLSRQGRAANNVASVGLLPFFHFRTIFCIFFIICQIFEPGRQWFGSFQIYFPAVINFDDGSTLSREVVCDLFFAGEKFKTIHILIHFVLVQNGLC